MTHKRTKYTRELLEPLIKESFSYQEVLRKLGLKAEGGGNIQNLKRNIELFGLDSSHFTGQAWASGKTNTTDKRIKRSYTDEELFSFPSPMKGSLAGTLKPRLIQLGVPYQCNSCGLKDSWLNKPITIELHHRNGNRLDNRVENLEFLCPNCHSQTDTHRGRNIPRAKKEALSKVRKSGAESLCIDKEDFHTLLWTYAMQDLALLFKVSDETIRQWASKHKINYPTHSFWMRTGVKENYDTSLLYEARELYENGMDLVDAVKLILGKSSKVGSNPKGKGIPKPDTRKVVRPSSEDLHKMLWKMPTNKIADLYGVSDKAIEKWAKFYGITKPPRGYWAKQYSQKPLDK